MSQGIADSRKAVSRDSVIFAFAALCMARFLVRFSAVWHRREGKSLPATSPISTASTSLRDSNEPSEPDRSA